MEIILETLQAIDMLENAQASVIADKLNISPSTFSNRIKKLLKKSLVKQTSKGKEKWYSLTETGKHLLGERKTDNEKVDNFGDILKMLLSKSFDDTYQLIDIFFEKPPCYIAKYGIFENLEFDPEDPLVADFYRSLIRLIYSASYQKLDKKMFSDFLNSSGNYSYDIKFVIFFIANIYSELSHAAVSKKDVYTL